MVHTAWRSCDYRCDHFVDLELRKFGIVSAFARSRPESFYEVLGTFLERIGRFPASEKSENISSVNEISSRIVLGFIIPFPLKTIQSSVAHTLRAATQNSLSQDIAIIQ